MSSSGSLKKILEYLRGKKFTGRIDITNNNGQQWRIYLCLSRLVWADGGYHPYREWQRLLHKYFPNLDPQLLDMQTAKAYECWNYYVIVSLLQRFLITKTQAYSLINDKLKQVFLDIYQVQETEKLNYQIVKVKDNFSQESGLKISIALFKIESVLQEVESEWSQWKQLDLIPWNPNFAPIIKNPVLLQQQFKEKEKTYKKLVSLFNGRYSLTEVADKINVKLIQIMIWLKPYFERGIIDLVEVKDVNITTTLIGINNDDYKIINTNQQRLIACIDDSVQVGEIMKHIITEEGYQFMLIQDPLKALPKLIRKKPDIILLDLVMPIVNGYEICTQIRRVSALKDIPIIILTGNDSMVDRLRSKIVGANAFLSKPIDQEKLLTKIKSLLSASKPNIASSQTLHNLADKSKTRS